MRETERTENFFLDCNHPPKTCVENVFGKVLFNSIVFLNHWEVNENDAKYSNAHHTYKDMCIKRLSK